MPTKAAFIGINKYRDPAISNLSGAKRDAVALEALFADTIPDLDARLLTDESATLPTVRAALAQLLTNAAPDDVVILSFAGHGSRDHRLVLHDSIPTSDSSMLAMSELAELFRTSPAKTILCVLDCCFSGEAPARVLDASPAPRMAVANWDALFSGKGRVLLAAASPTEPAWEQASTGHGLLTKAVIDTLTDASGPFDVGDAMDRIMALVRAEAARMGKVQTPTRIGYVEGGLTLPKLVPGTRYAAAFPERVGLTVTAALADLARFGIPVEAIGAWSARFPAGLNTLQVAAVNEHRLLDGRNLLVVAPTGAGKTFIGELAAIHAIAEGRRAVFVLPYRALVNEKYEEFVALYGEQMHLQVIRCTGDHQDQTSAFARGKYDIAILTYEMFLSLALSRRGAANHFGVVVLDEAQFITDPGRGIAVELLLTLMLGRRDAGASPQIVALSAVIGSVNGFDQWLSAGLLATAERPVPLVEGVVDRSGRFQYRDVDGTLKMEQFVPAHEIHQRRAEASAQDLIVPLTRRLIADGETVIVFRNSRGAAQGCANYLANDLSLPSASEALGSLAEHDQSSSSAELRRCLTRGVGFHTANLTREERVAVERAFRATDQLRVMAATTTLAAGINTPASTVILAENEFLGEDGRPFTIAEYKNMAGRAGRPGYGRNGRSIIYAESPIERERLFARYVLGQPEAVRSSFDAADLDTWILRLLSQVDEVAKDEVVSLLANTYAGYVAALADPDWQERTRHELQKLLDEMLSLNLLEQERGNVRLTLLGRACGQSSLSFRSCLRLVDLLRRQGATVSVTNLMLLIQGLNECDEAYTPIMSRAKVEKDRPAQLMLRVGERVVRELQHHARDDKSYLQRCKRGLILLDWIAGTPIGAIEERYSPSPYQGTIGLGDVRRFADLTRFHLRAASDIARILFISTPSEDDTEAVLRALEFGIPAELHDLLELNAGWNRGELLALLAAGVRTQAEIWSFPIQRAIEVLGAERYAKLERLRPAVMEPSSLSVA